MRNSSKGQSLIEFTIAVIIFVPFIFLLLDVFLIMTAMQINNTVCAEAARIASIGDPRLAVARAQEIIANPIAASCSYCRVTFISTNSTIAESQLQALLPYGGQVTGTVTVRTQVSIKPTILSLFLGHTQLCVISQQEFPSTYVIPNQLELSSPAQTVPAQSVGAFNSNSPN